MTELKGSFDGKGFRVAVVTARFNDLITSRLTEACCEALRRHGVRDDKHEWATGLIFVHHRHPD